MRILIRTSKWAIWARRMGALALPLAFIPVLLHHQRLITSENFIVIEAIALGLAVLAVVMGFLAFVRLWFTGDQGWGRATLGLVFGAVCLLPAAYFAYAALTQPASPDFSTDFASPPELLSFVPAPFIGPTERAALEAAFPNARTRNYPIAVDQMFSVIETLSDDNGWELRARRAPQDVFDTGQLNVLVTTLLGFRQEVVFRVVGTTDGATVAMRSASLTTFPDFGENGARIEAFLVTLDAQVTQMLRNAAPTPVAPD